MAVEEESPFDGITNKAWEEMLQNLQRLYGKYLLPDAGEE